MSEYRIVCTEQSDPRPEYGRILAVRVAVIADVPGTRFSVEEVRILLDQGHSFYVLNALTGSRAWVAKFHVGDVETIRTYADGQWNNNLDALPPC